MEKKRVKKFIYEGLGFPIILTGVQLVKVREVWTPAINYNKLQKQVLLALSYKPFPLTGHEVHFIRSYFEMTLDEFGKCFGEANSTATKWEKAKSKPAKITPTAELLIRLFILEKFKVSDRVFHKAFIEFCSKLKKSI